MDDIDVIRAFVNQLAEDGEYPDLRVEQRPDQINRETPDIDAIAGPFAIEHTSIDTVKDQRRDSARFKCVVGDIEQELEGKLPFRLYVWFKYDAVSKGQDWAAICIALKKWVINESPYLPDGKSVAADIPGIPFQLEILKSSDRPGGVYFARTEPKDSNLAERVREILERKATKLAKYQAPATITVLLVESDDIAIMSEPKMLEAICEAFPDGPPQGVDQVWFADTTISGRLRFVDFTSFL